MQRSLLRQKPERDRKRYLYHLDTTHVDYVPIHRRVSGGTLGCEDLRELSAAQGEPVGVVPCRRSPGLGGQR